MLAAGLVVTLSGFLIAVASLGLAASTTGRLTMVLVGIAVSLGGIIGLVNRHYLQTAAWKN